MDFDPEEKECESLASDGGAGEPDHRGPSGDPSWHTANIRAGVRKKIKIRYLGYIEV